jgi:hypothetical protein
MFLQPAWPISVPRCQNDIKKQSTSGVHRVNRSDTIEGNCGFRTRPLTHLVCRSKMVDLMSAPSTTVYLSQCSTACCSYGHLTEMTHDMLKAAWWVSRVWFAKATSAETDLLGSAALAPGKNRPYWEPDSSRWFTVRTPAMPQGLLLYPRMSPACSYVVVVALVALVVVMVVVWLVLLLLCIPQPSGYTVFLHSFS